MENLEIKIKTIEPSKSIKAVQSIQNIVSFVKNVLSVPDRRVMIRLKDHHATNNKKSLTKSIVTEILVFKNVQRINVKTDIQLRYLLKL